MSALPQPASPSSPLATAPASTLPPTMAGATFLARLDAIRADMAAFDAQRRTWCPGRAADGTSRENLRRHILTNLTALLGNTAEYAHRLDAERAAVTPDQGRINRLQRIVADSVVDIEEYERMAAELAGVLNLQQLAAE